MVATTLQGRPEGLEVRVLRGIRRLMADQDVSTTELARRCSWTQSKASRIVTGQTPLTVEMVEQMLGALGSDLRTLLDVTNDNRPTPAQGISPSLVRSLANLEPEAVGAALAAIVELHRQEEQELRRIIAEHEAPEEG